MVEETAAPGITTASEIVTAAPVADQVAPTAYLWTAPGVHAGGPDLREFDEKIANARRDKESAIDAQDFDRAARLRDSEKQLLAQRKAAVPGITTASETVSAAPVADQVAPTAYPWTAAVGPSYGPGHPAWQQPAANTATKNNSGGPGAVFTLLGGILITVGSFLPWLTVVGNMGAVDISGMAGGRDGVITLVPGVIVLGVGLARLVSRVSPLLQWVPVIICGAITLLIVAADLQDINNWVNSNPDTYDFLRSTGPGLYLLIVGAIVAIVGSLIVSRETLRVPFHHGATRILGCSQEDAARLAAIMGVRLTDEYSLTFFVSLRDRLRQDDPPPPNPAK